MIKTTLIGHACLIIQSRESNILTDPVWFDYLWEDINVLCPSMVLDKSKIPSIDILNISHRHQDHFDIRTLAYLARNDQILKPDVTILAPNDPLLLDILKELEFKNIRVVTDFEPIRIKDVTLTPTPSLNKEEGDFIEHGLLVSDEEVTVWNQVDTVVNPEIIQYIREKFGRLDFVHAQFLPLLEGKFSYHKPLNLPFEQYGTSLNVVKSLWPKYVVPASAGFRFRDKFAFLNQYTFPVSSEQFLRDLAVFCPEVSFGTFLPGDVAYISSEGVCIEKQTSDFVRLGEDDSHRINFKPVMEVPSIQTQTKNFKKHEQEMIDIRSFIENRFMDRIVNSEIFSGWKHWQVFYQLEVFGKEESEIWSIDFSQSEPRIQKGDLGKINLYEGIGASELYALIEGQTSWDFVALCGNYRTFNNVYRIADGKFEYYPLENIDNVLEPLMEVFPSDSKMDREKFMKQVRRWKGKA